MADPSPASTKARVGRYAKRVEALRSQHERALLGELDSAEMVEACAEYGSLRVEGAKLAIALSYVEWRKPGETMKAYKARMTPAAVEAAVLTMPGQMELTA